MAFCTSSLAVRASEVAARDGSDSASPCDLEPDRLGRR